MNSLCFSSSPPLFPSLCQRPLHYTTPQCCYFGSNDHRQCKRHFSRSSLSYPYTASTLSNFHLSYMGANALSNEGTVPVMNFEELIEKDWSFLEMDDNPQVGHNVGRIISAGELESTSKVLVSFGSEGFVDRLVDTSSCQLLLVVHDSLLVLACIKEKYDKVKCWQGELIYVPEKWAPFDVAYIYYLPALPFSLDQVFEALAKRCLPGARVIISHPLGRQVLEQQRQEFPDCIVSDLPDKMTLEKVAVAHSFEMAEFVDEPGFYLTVLKFNGA
ncbi:uncharacterized protein LOC115729641 [Rhodamnia argentea]|uniref:Uncharacterized protein LOC115729641 n=1 Tax=Rhodamnia argentea TaxID=178133 RepID=A0A8B8N0Y0_9MYRT|nr:uncharacterized protein LOC115729641 [Rhodamnia argentea]XP_030516114.1 uncharacterized protein LOC115729641 [Rhodamnia argentea]XP_030516115.1 uncharacterized protein LOC115729641 [Rhodamnia argentea]